MAAGKPGAKWYKGFKARHPEISKRVSDHLDMGRRNLTEQTVVSHLDALQDIHNEYPGLPPSNIFNGDEFGLQPDGKKLSVLTPRGADHTHTGANQGRFSITCLPVIGADGSSLPPFVVVKGGGLAEAEVVGKDG